MYIYKLHFFPAVHGDKQLLNTLKHASVFNLKPPEVPLVKQGLIWETLALAPCLQETGSETQMAWPEGYRECRQMHWNELLCERDQVTKSPSEPWFPGL